MFFLLRDDGGFCYETFGALVKALNNTAFTDLRWCESYAKYWSVCVGFLYSLVVWGGCQVLLKLRCLGRRVCCLSLSPWWSGWKAAGCLNAVRSHLRFRVGLDMYKLTTGEYTVVFKLYILSCQLPLILSTKRMSPFNLGSNYCRTFREQCVTVTNVNDINYAAKGIN